MDAKEFNIISDIVESLTKLEDSDEKSIMLQSVYFGLKAIENIGDKVFDLSTVESQLEFVTDVFGITFETASNNGPDPVVVKESEVDMDLVNLINGVDSDNNNMSLTDAYNKFADSIKV